MACATILTPVMGDPLLSATLPLFLGVLAVVVAYGRWRRRAIAARQPAHSHDFNLATR
jgi:hypothetical protein